MRLPTLLLVLASWFLCNNSAADSPRQRDNFDSDWHFYLGDIEEGSSPKLNDDDWRSVDLPHDWSVEAPFSPEHASGTGFLPGGIGWYRKSFTLPAAVQGRHVEIEFDGVYRNSDVWINGVHLGHRPYGYSHFRYDLTPHLRYGEGATNLLAVRVARENIADSRWYPGTGIYRHVWLTQTDPLHVVPHGIFVTTPRVTNEVADVCVKTEVINPAAEEAVVRIVSRLVDADGTTVSQVKSEKRISKGQTAVFSDWQNLPEPKLWSPDSPALYTLATDVFVGEHLVDEVRTPFGIRTIRFDHDKGFFLNGKNLLIKGLCMHHDAGALGAAVPEAVLRRRLEIVKDLGANAVRCSHNPMAPEFYDLCDQLGLLVMDEAFDEWEIGKRKWVKGRNAGHADRFGYSEWFAEWGERDAADMVLAHRNHPSIILWSIGNEIDYPTDPYIHPESRHDPDFDGFPLDGHPPVTRLTHIAPRLIAAIKRHDLTRPVTMALANVPAANGIGLADMLDVAGYNYQEQFYEENHQLFPGRVMLGSENGRYGSRSWRTVRDNAYISGLFYWVGFDFLGEAGEWPNHGSTAGVFDSRGFLKTTSYGIQAQWSDKPFVRLAVSLPPIKGEERNRRNWWRLQPRRHWNWDNGSDLVVVTVFSNCSEVDLSLNGRSLGKKSVNEDGVARWTIAYEPGVLTVNAQDAGEVVATDQLQTAGTPSRIEGALYETGPLSSGETAHMVLRVVDDQGVLVRSFDQPVTVAINGGGQLLAIDNGNQRDPTPFSNPTRIPSGGRLLVIVQAAESDNHEPLTLTVTSPDLPPSTIEIPRLQED